MMIGTQWFPRQKSPRPAAPWLCVALLWLALLACWATAEDSLHIAPPRIALASPAEAQRVIVVRNRDDGTTEDVTGRCQLSIVDPGRARCDGPLVVPLEDGATRLRAECDGLTAEVDVEVRNMAAPRAIGFQRDVIPVLTRHGCNSGACHGSSRGQDGFRLSLFGFDPRGDYHRITREMAGRRIHLAVPEASLLLDKATGSVPHTGGKRMAVGGPAWEMLVRWLEQGATWDEGAAVVDRIEVFPREAVMAGVGGTQPLAVLANYSDGTQRDVTAWSVFLSTDESVAKINADGTITAEKRGESFVTARFDVHTVGLPVIVLPTDVPYEPPVAEGNFIDQCVGEKLARLRLRPGPICSDEVFLRRCMIDTLGVLPTREEYQSFLADASPEKRQQLVDRLLARSEFSDLWSAEWADLLMIRELPNVMSRKAAQIYFEWLRDQFAQGVPLDQLALTLLTGSGATFEHPEANFYAVEPDRLKLAENTAQLFLGIRIQCAQCHNHPFDRWTMNDYYGFADFFAGVQRKPDEDYRQWVISGGAGQTLHPVTGAPVPARFLGGDSPADLGSDRRALLAQWLTSPDNPYFARSMANRVWSHFFGRGVVEPVDDVRISNPPSNGPLYDALGSRLVEHQFDLCKLVRDILTSQTYQRATAAPGDLADERNFSHMAVRRIPAPQLLDCLSQVTESPEKFRGLPLGQRAVQTLDQAPDNYFLTTFGRSTRASVCACETRNEPTLSQALHLINGNTVHEKIKAGGVVARALEQGKTPEQVVELLYVRCLSRPPTSHELETLLSAVRQAASPQQGLEDVFWALLNSPEFVFNR